MPGIQEYLAQIHLEGRQPMEIGPINGDQLDELSEVIYGDRRVRDEWIQINNDTVNRLVGLLLQRKWNFNEPTYFLASVLSQRIAVKLTSIRVSRIASS